MHSGTLNLGYEYQKIVPAYLALQLMLDKKVTSFKLVLNPSSYAKFDDLYVEIQIENNKQERFWIQLKHRDKGKDVVTASEEFSRTDSKNKPKSFNVNQYLGSYKSQSVKDQEKDKFILFTNVKFTNIDKVPGLAVKSVKNPFNSQVFNVNEIYQFQQTGNPFVYKNFFLISGQKNVYEIVNEITNIFTSKLHADANIATLYIHFFNDLHNKQYINSEITEETIIMKMIQLLFSPFAVQYPITKEANKRIQLIENMISKFDVTILSSLDKSFIKKNWTFVLCQQIETLTEEGQRLKLLKSHEKISQDTSQFILTILLKKNIFLEINENLKFESVAEIIRRLKSSEKYTVPLVLLTDIKQLDQKKYSYIRFFDNLQQLHNTDKSLYDEAVNSLEISIQGRNSTTVQDLIENYNLPLNEFFTPNEIFQLIQESFVIGEKIVIQTDFVKRNLLKDGVNIEHLENLCSFRTTKVYCGEHLIKFKQLLNTKFPKINVIENSDFDKDKIHKSPTVIITNEPIQKTDCHTYNCFSLTRFGNLQWVDNEISIDELLQLKTHMIILYGKPGIGKSSMIKFLFHRFPLNYWIVIVNLHEVGPLFTDASSTNEILQKFVELSVKSEFEEKLCKNLLKKKKIVFLLDGLNELNNASMSKAVLIFKEIAEKGFRIFIACTKSLKSYLDNTLNIWSSFFVQGFPEKDQQDYIHQKLKNSKIEEASIKHVIEKIYDENKTEYRKMLKVPLILHILTEILCTDPSLENVEDIFNLHKLYTKFVDGKLKHNLKKINCEHLDQLYTILETFKYFYFKECKNLALKICLHKAIVKMLGVKVDDNFPQLIKSDNFMGILQVSNKNKFGFTHYTFAEYFAADWIFENFHNLSVETKTFIFDVKYNGIRRFFDARLAEDCPLHMAVLNQNIVKVKKYAQEYKGKLDQGGRTALHLAASLGRQHIRDIKGEEDKFYKINESSFKKTEEIFKYLLNESSANEVNQKDTLFGWNVFEYAEAALCLYSLEELSKRHELKWEYLKIYNEHFYTLSYYCVAMGYVNLLKIAITKIGLETLEKEHDKKSLIHLAIENYQEEVAKLLMEHEINVNRINGLEQTTLHKAASKGYYEIVNLLLEKETNIEPLDGLGRTPLYLAARMGYLEIVKLLVEKGHGKLDINHPASDGSNAIHRAAESGFHDVVKFLIENGGDINSYDRDKDTTLHYAVSGGHEDVVKYLITTTINLIAQNENKKTAKDIAVEEGYSEIVKILEKAEQNYSPPSAGKKSQLYEATENGELSTVEKLIQERNINDDNDSLGTLLCIAAHKGHLELVKFFLNKNVDVSATNKDGETPLHLACREGHLETVKILIKSGHISARDKWGFTPFHHAAYAGRINIMKELKENGADINCRCNDNFTPCIRAAYNGQVEALEWLIENGCDINATTNKKQTCLHQAALRGRRKTVKYLCDAYTEMINLRDSDGRTPLFLAVDRNYFDTVKILVEAGADIKAQSNFKTDSIGKARLKGHKEILNFLLENSTSNV